MRIAICDDDLKTIKSLSKLLLEYFKNKYHIKPEIYAYSKGEDFLKDNKQADIIFMDIIMSGINGIETTKKYKEIYPDALVVILTDYGEYLDDAMQQNVFRYLSKPVKPERLFPALDYAVERLKNCAVKFKVSDSTKTVVLNSSDIIEFEFLNVTRIVTRSGTFYSELPLKSWWDKVSGLPYFFYSHRNYIVNTNYVATYDENSITLKYDNKSYTARLTKRKHSAFDKAVFKSIES